MNGLTYWPQWTLKPPIQGPTVQPTVPARFTPLDSPRSDWWTRDYQTRTFDLRPVPIQGATVQQTIPPRFSPLDGPRSDWYTREYQVRQFESRLLPIPGPSGQQTPPERFVPLESPRSDWWTREYQTRQFEARLNPVMVFGDHGGGAVKIDFSIPVLLDSPDLLRYRALDVFARRNDAFQPPIQGSTNQQTHPIPPLPLPDQAAYAALHGGRYRFDLKGPVPVGGTTSQPQTYPKLLDVPDQARYFLLNQLRWMFGLTGPIQGAILQQTYPALLDGPDQARYFALQLNRYLADLKLPSPNPVAQTYPALLDSPDLARFLALDVFSRRDDSRKPPLPGAISQQTYPGLLDTPDQVRYLLLQLRRWNAELLLPIHGASAAIPKNPRIYLLVKSRRVFDLQPTLRGGTPAMLVDTKDPKSTEDFQFNWATELGVDTIATSTWSASGVTAGASSNTDTTTTVRLSGGKSGTVANVINTITCASGQTKRRQLQLTIYPQ